MAKQTGVYGVYFMKGAFHLKVTEMGEDLIAQPIHSKNCERVKFLGGNFKSLEELLESPRAEKIREAIETLDFDFLILGHGESVSYYINTADGLEHCDLSIYGA